MRFVLFFLSHSFRVFSTLSFNASFIQEYKLMDSLSSVPPSMVVPCIEFGDFDDIMLAVPKLNFYLLTLLIMFLHDAANYLSKEKEKVRSLVWHSLVFDGGN